ncbi:ROK family transcriptional regulator [Amycolatopsis sp. NPDC051371]|uniref:ROK family transcriptional regulator n=1 Tax=Amycolatopsis sp. NPDC051371 TaxID=3155800 RepID=UPI003435C010
MTTRASSPAGLQLDSLRRSNASVVLKAVRDTGPVSRSEIAAVVGLSPAAITKIIVELERAGCITEAAPAQSQGRGRPRTPVTLDLARHRFLGVHIGMQRVTAGLVDLGGNLIGLRARKHRSSAPSSVLSTARRLVGELIDQTGVQPADVVGYGACTGGWVPPDSGAVRAFEGLGWRDVAFSDGLRVEGLPVPRVESTVRALALTEARLAANAGRRNILYLFVGNVIGCAHVVDGAIARGQHDAAGIIDHVSSGAKAAVACTCGRYDCLWAVASDAALTAAAHNHGLLTGDAGIDDLVTLSEGTGQQARTARRMLDQRATRVGTTVAGLIDIYDPDLAVIGGGDLATSAVHFERMASTAAERGGGRGREPVPVRPAVLVGPPGLVQGAATSALDAFYADPLALA